MRRRQGIVIVATMVVYVTTVFIYASQTLRPGRYTITLADGGLALDANAPTMGSNDGKVHLWQNNGGPTQVWNVAVADAGNYTITLAATGMALDADGPTMHADGGKVHLWQYNGGKTQVWNIRPSDNNTYEVVLDDGGKALDAAVLSMHQNDGLVHLWSLNQGKTQKWNFTAHGGLLTAAMDILPSNVAPTTSQLDDNRFYRNPLWRWAQLGNGQPDACLLCPCGADDTPAIWNQDPTCTSQPLRENRKDPLCKGKVNSTDSRIPYHMNWRTVDYEGILSGFEHSPAIFGDNDYNFFITTDNGSLYTKGATSVEIEFDASETVDHFDNTHTWWDTFHHQHVDKNQGEASTFIKGKFAIVIGMLGLDVAHVNHHSELHPAYAMFINTSTSPAEDQWAFFVRNWGNEGFCGPDQVGLSAPELKIRLKQRSASGGSRGTLAQPKLAVLRTKNINRFSDNDVNQCPSVNNTTFTADHGDALFTFPLGDPSKRCGFVGDLTVDWKDVPVVNR